ncbi:MAG: hypothetical protein JXA33_06930 [Anaerolineae bacterium]|nr:hypothetical protein [Anaerolineae bacterium]
MKIKFAIWKLLVLLLLLLPALLPFLQPTRFPCTHDNSLHYHRIVAMREALRQGWVFSRWVPNLALGYGYPFFNFREPLPYLVGELLYVLGLPLPLVLGILYTASFLAAAGGMFLLAREVWQSERSAWVAALAYGLGPYLLLDALRRGNMPESVALALLPWVLWSFRRVVLGAGRGAFMTSVGLLVALFLSHNISSLLFAPLLGGYVVLLAWIYQERRAWLWAFVAVGLALLLTAWFWVPALLEQDTVHLHLSRTTRNNDFHYNFATWREILFTLPTPYDVHFINPPMHVPLGIVQWGVALIGGIVTWARVSARKKRVGAIREQHATLIFCAVIALGYLWMSNSTSVGVWEAFSLLAFIQFPWRLVGRALLPVALLSGAVFANQQIGESQIANHKSRMMNYVLSGFLTTSLFYLLLVLLVVTSWSGTYPPKGWCAIPEQLTMADVYAFERSGWMGVDPEGSYFPVAVEQRPDDASFPGGATLAEAFERGNLPARLDIERLPDDARVIEATYRPLQATLVVESPVAFEARWLGFYYPGWQARVDGERVDVAPEEDTGLLTFVIPAGTHKIQVYFGTTVLRGTVSLISLSTLCVFLFMIFVPDVSVRIRIFSILRSRFTPHASCLTFHVSRFTLHHYLIALIALVLLLFRLLVIDRVPNPVQRARLEAGALPEVENRLEQPFANGMTLQGYTIGNLVVKGDAELEVDLLWAVWQRPAREARTSILLMGSDDQAWSLMGTARPRGYESTPQTTQWLPGQYAYDPHMVMLLPGIPPGDYQVVASIFDKDKWYAVSVLGEDGNPAGPDLTLGTVRVTSPVQIPSLHDLEVPSDAEMQSCGALGLWAMTADRTQAAPGEVMGVRWVWEALAVPTTTTVTLTLRDLAGQQFQSWSLPPVAEWWPTDQWRTGERWIGRPVIRLSGNLDSGNYVLETRLPGCEQVLATTALEVIAPDRTWEAPDDWTPLEVSFHNVVEQEEIRLVAYEFNSLSLPPGNPFRVRLAWQASTELDTAYRVFVHVLGADGRLLAQNDGEPAEWARPTTGWAVGEVVIDKRKIVLPRDATLGDYQVRVGLYIPDGPRLLTHTGEDGYVIDILQIRDP